MIQLLLATALGGIQPAPCAIDGSAADFEVANGVECGWVSVPRRADAPDGPTIRLWTARLRASGPDKQGDPVLFINGGPGIATVDSILPAIPGSRNLAMLRRERDVIVFDQRGSGRSEEALCPELGDRLNAIKRQGLSPESEEESGRRAFVECRQTATQAGFDVDAYTTRATVADIDRIRQAYGVERLNLVAVSYGTLVALQVMRENPQRVRSAILNSPYPPNSASWAEQESVAVAGYEAIDRACSRRPACQQAFGDLVPKLEAILQRLERNPVRDGERLITGRLFAQSLWPLAVQSPTVRFVPLAIHRSHSGDDDLIRRLVAAYGSGDAFGGNSPAQGFAISCHESGRTAHFYARARALYPAMVSPAPDDSWDRMCAAYRPGFADPAFFAPVASDIPTLLYAGELDPATPVFDALHAARFLARGTIVEVAGASHAPMGRDDCTRGIADAFLANPEGEPDLSCLGSRETLLFATEGLDELLTPSEN